MGPEVVNKNKNCVFNGLYAGRDQYIIMLEDKEREFVVTHNANIKPVSYFIGRETELQELRQRIDEGRKSVLVSGMGGIGKTHICRKLFEEYLNKHAENENGSFRHLGYIEYNGDMGSSLQNCLKFKKQDSPEQNQEAAWRELEYLASDGKLLLFVDNVNVPIGSDPGLEKLRSIPGAIVLTSRRTSFSKEFESYRIGFLDTEQCKVIYERIRYGDSGIKVSEEEIPDLDYIIDEMAAGHTITIEFLAHLARTKHWNAKELRSELESKGFQLKYRDEEDKLINIQEEYEKLYDLSVLTEAEQNILEAFSVFPSIPLAAETCNEWLLADARASEDDDIMVGLYQKGWLQFDMEQESYSLHPVFAQFIFDKCKPRWIRHVGLIDACQKYLDIPESGLILGCYKYIPFAESILEKVDMGKNLKRADFAFALAYLYRYIGNLKKAEQWYKESLEIHEENYMLPYMRKFKESEQKYIDAFGNIWEEKHLNLATIYASLGEVYIWQGNYEKAKEYLEKCMIIRESVLGVNHASTANVYNTIGGYYSLQGEDIKAKDWYEKSLVIRKKVLKKDHKDIVNSYNNLGQVQEKLGNYRKSFKMYNKCLKILQCKQMEEHHGAAIIYNNLGSLYKKAGTYKNAERMYKKSLEIYLKTVGENHPDTANMYNYLIELYVLQRKDIEAQSLYQEKVELLLSVFGKFAPEIAICYNNYAIACERQRNHIKALGYFFKAYKIYVIQFGVIHQDAKKVYKNMQIVFNKLLKYGDFRRWFRQKMKESD